MEDCNLSYVPEHLHSQGRNPITDFYIGEHLFRRCTSEQLSSPFEKENLYDLSVNRQGNPLAPISVSEDALWNCDGKEEVGECYNMEIAHYEIKELEDNQYRKTILVEGVDGDGKPEIIGCTITLKHDILPCNYAHTVVAFIINDTTVTKSNYSGTLGKKGKKWSDLRSRCKQEIEQMRCTNEIWINWPPVPTA